MFPLPWHYSRCLPRLTAALSTLTIGVLTQLVLAGPASATSPTNLEHPFTIFDLYTHRIASAGVINNVFLPVYPGSVSNPMLLVKRTGTDSVAFYNSHPTSAVGFEVNGSTPASFVDFQIDPPQYMTSVGTLCMAYLVFVGDAVDGFYDCGKPLFTAVARFTDGDSAIVSLVGCNHLRNWARQPAYNCFFGPQPLNIAPPTDSLAAVIFEDNTNGYYYDMQELRLPGAKRNKKVKALHIQSNLLAHTCNQINDLTAGGYLSGLTTWPRFRIVNRAGTPVVQQRQDVGAYAADPYGGYLFNGSVVGAERTIADLGCGIACFSMMHNYFGINGGANTPGTVNTWLQQHHGYRPFGGGMIDSAGTTAVGNRVRFAWNSNGTWGNGAKFLIEQGNFNPVATIMTLSTSNGICRAQITTVHQAIATLGGRALVRSDADPQASSAQFSNDAWGAQIIGAAAQAESAFVDSLPVMLHVWSNVHWVVGEGMTPAFLPPSDAAATYTIGDPLAQSGRLIGAPFGNVFTHAMRAVRQTQRSPEPPAITAAASGGLWVAVEGPAAVTLTDPSGRAVLYNWGSDSYGSSIPGAFAFRKWVAGNGATPSLNGPPHDAIELPGTGSGTYRLTVVGQGTGKVGITAEAYDASAAGSMASTTWSASSGDVAGYLIAYDQTGAAPVSITGTTSVETTAGVSVSSITVVPNPMYATATISWRVDRAGPVKVELRDIQGRRVVGLAEGWMEPGMHRVEYAMANGRFPRVAPGIYFVVVSMNGQSNVTRMVVLEQNR